MSRCFRYGLLLLSLLLAVEAGAGSGAAVRDPRLDRAFDLAAKGEKAAAAGLLATYLQEFPDDQQTLAWYGEVQLDLLQIEEAIATLQPATANRSDPLALRELAESYLLLGDLKRAESVYETLQAEMPANRAIGAALEEVRKRARSRQVIVLYYRGIGVALFIFGMLGLGLVLLAARYLERLPVQSGLGNESSTLGDLR